VSPTLERQPNILTAFFGDKFTGYTFWKGGGFIWIGLHLKTGLACNTILKGLFAPFLLRIFF